MCCHPLDWMVLAWVRRLEVGRGRSRALRVWGDDVARMGWSLTMGMNHLLFDFAKRKAGEFKENPLKILKEIGTLSF